MCMRAWNPAGLAGPNPTATGERIMKKEEVTIGGTYSAKVGSRTPDVRIGGWHAKGSWNARAGGRGGGGAEGQGRTDALQGDGRGDEGEGAVDDQRPDAGGDAVQRHPPRDLVQEGRGAFPQDRARALRPEHQVRWRHERPPPRS